MGAEQTRDQVSPDGVVELTKNVDEFTDGPHALPRDSGSPVRSGRRGRVDEALAAAGSSGRVGEHPGHAVVPTKSWTIHGRVTRGSVGQVTWKPGRSTGVGSRSAGLSCACWTRWRYALFAGTSRTLCSTLEWSSHCQRPASPYHEIQIDLFVDFMVRPLRCIRSKPIDAAREVHGFGRRHCRRLSADQLLDLVALLQTLK